MAGQALAAHLASRRAAIATSSSLIQVVSASAPGHEVVARQVELDRVDAVLEEHAHRLAHLVGAVDDAAEATSPGYGRCGSMSSPSDAGDGDLLARREVARARDLAGVDGVADHARRGAAWASAAPTQEVQPESRYCLATCAAHSVCSSCGMLLDRVQRLGVGPAEVRVRLAHARHQRGAGAVDHRDAGRRGRLRVPRPMREMRLPCTSTSPV